MVEYIIAFFIGLLIGFVGGYGVRWIEGLEERLDRHEEWG